MADLVSAKASQDHCTHSKRLIQFYDYIFLNDLHSFEGVGHIISGTITKSRSGSCFSHNMPVWMVKLHVSSHTTLLVVANRIQAFPLSTKCWPILVWERKVCVWYDILHKFCHFFLWKVKGPFRKWERKPATAFHGLLFPISSLVVQTMAFVIPIVKHLLEQEIVQQVYHECLIR